MSEENKDVCAVCGESPSVTVGLPRVQLIEGNFSRIRVRAQDVVVVCSESTLTGQHGLRPMFPGNKIVVLDEGLEIGVMAPVREEDCDPDEDDGR
jgi:hypothetical protein